MDHSENGNDSPPIQYGISAWLNWNTSEHHHAGWARKLCTTRSPYEYVSEPCAGTVSTVRTASWVVRRGSGAGVWSGCGLISTASSETVTGVSAALSSRIPTGEVSVSPLRK